MIDTEAGTAYKHAVPIAYRVRYIADGVLETDKFLVARWQISKMITQLSS